MSTIDLDAPVTAGGASSSQRRFAVFGDHLTLALMAAARRDDLRFIDAEPAPKAAPRSLATSFWYGLGAARLGPIEHPGVLAAALAEAREQQPAARWIENGGRYYDPARPMVEPGGFNDARQVELARSKHLECLLAATRSATDVVVGIGSLRARTVAGDPPFVLPLVPPELGVGGSERSMLPSNANVLQLSLEALAAQLRALNPAASLVLAASPAWRVAEDGETATTAEVTRCGEHLAMVRRVADDFASASGGTVRLLPLAELAASIAPSVDWWVTENEPTPSRKLTRRLAGLFRASLDEQDVALTTQDSSVPLDRESRRERRRAQRKQQRMIAKD